MNRADALERLVELLKAGAYVPKPRIATRPTLASKKRRLDAKTTRSGVKTGSRTAARRRLVLFGRLFP